MKKAAVQDVSRVSTAIVGGGILGATTLWELGRAILDSPAEHADMRRFRLGRFAAAETCPSRCGGNRA